jgi:hypothetical protein
VFALRLNRRKLAENPLDLIRRKFSIDAGFCAKSMVGAARVHHFETIPAPVWKPDVHHLRRMGGLTAPENPANAKVFDSWPARLSVRLISL